MSELEKVLKKNEELEKRILALEGIKTEIVPKIETYSFSRISDTILEKLVDIEKNYERVIFEDWFNFKYQFDENLIKFLNDLIDRNELLISDYHEEDLKINFIAPLITKVDFFMLKDRIRSFYNEKLIYKTDKFIFNGEADFIVSKGMKRAKKPYFFIQEFKKGEEFGNPRPQLLAEMISAVELNKTKSMKGAFIVGKDWNFVILEKLGKDKYQYFLSEAFNSTKIAELKRIYKNLQFVKNEVIEMVRQEKSK